MNGKLLFSLVPVLLFSQTAVEGYLENSLNDMAQTGARVVVSSSKGVNWSNDIRVNPPVWEGITDITPTSSIDPYYRDGILLSESEMIVQVESGANGFNWLYYNFDTEETEIKNYTPAGLSQTNVYYGRRGDVLGNRFFHPLYKGGVLEIVNGDAAQLYIPGLAGIYDANSYTYQNELDSTGHIISVISDSLGFSALADGRLWRFNFADSTWSSDTLSDAYTYETIENSSTGILLFAKETSGSKTSQIIPIGASEPLIKGEVGVMRESALGHYYSLIDTGMIEPRNSIDGKIIDEIDHYGLRISNSDGFGGAYTVWDIDYDIVDTDTLFTIATTQGFLYSTNAHGDERDNTPFQYVRKDRVLAVGLDEVYAVPFIIKDNEPAVFEYSISESAQISIDIYDYNMDFVCRLVDKEERYSASKSSTGQSTNRARDMWDGSRSGRGGETVSPGLYYFRITSDRGEQGFGKIIVAKN